MDAVAQAFRKERGSRHGAVIEAALAILRSRFAQDATADGYRKDVPVGVAKFELAKALAPSSARPWQHQASHVTNQLLGQIG